MKVLTVPPVDNVPAAVTVVFALTVTFLIEVAFTKRRVDAALKVALSPVRNTLLMSSWMMSSRMEKMMGAVARLAKQNGADCQLLLERYMKCGIGVCGHCACGDRLVCFDGPRFGFEILDNPEFEKVWRDKAGRKQKL